MVNKVKELLETINELTSPDEKIRQLVEALTLQNEDFEKLKEQFEEHEDFKPELAHGTDEE